MLTKKTAQKALLKRSSFKPQPLELRDDFSKQNAFINDTSKFLAAQCSRRSGKTNGLAIRFFKTMEKYPKSQCIYLSLTHTSAKDIMWPVLQELNDKHKIGCTFTESTLTVKHPNGAKLRLMGADLKNFIKRLKGRKYPGVAIDEAQDFGTHLQSLLDDVLTPSIADYPDGWVALAGTPGPVPAGFFFEVTQNNKYGFSVHKWTLLDNPYMPDPHKFIETLKVNREWEDNNPTLLREYKNQWVLDVESLWVRYKETVNNYTTLPNIMPNKYNYIMGIDIGFNDADAIAILAWSDVSPQIYLIEEVITPKQGITELVQQIESLMKKYDISKMVMDAGALGKKIAEEMTRRHHLPVQAADKTRKQENVELLNDYLRTGKFKAQSTSRFAQDSYLVQIDWDKSTPDKIVVKKKPHSDIIDAVLYAFKESPAFTYKDPPPKPVIGSKEWAEQQETSMFDAELEALQEQAAYNKRVFND